MSTANLPKVSRQKTIMVCDDESDVLRAYRLALNSRFNVLTAISGDDCVKAYSDAVGAQKPIDVVVLDYRLGDMMGDEVAKKLMGIAATNIILLTAFEIEPSRINELKHQKIISSFMKKPISLAALLEAIDELTAT